MSGGSKKVTVGYKYYLGMHMILCHGPIDAITRIDVNERTVWTGNANSQLTISADNVFGGEGREGGISGVVDVVLGTSTQPKNDYLMSVLGSNIPAYRDLAAVVMRRVYIGLNPYLKPWALWVRRILKRTDGSDQWYIAKASIGQYDMNASHIIRECLTDRVWGLGYPESLIGSSFTVVADTLYSENFGLSICWYKASSIDEFISEVLSHIDGVLYVNRVTGQFELKLIRDDFDESTVFELHEDINLKKLSNFKRPQLSELKNAVVVKYFDIEKGIEASVAVKDPSLQIQSRSNIETNSYLGISNAVTALKVAERDLKALSLPLAQCTAYANRDAASLVIGSPVKLTHSGSRSDGLIMRVTSIELGELTDNTVVLTLIEDKFSYSGNVYSNGGGSQWIKPQSLPSPTPYPIVTEATYYELATTMGDSDASAIDPLSSYLFASAVRPSSDAINMLLTSYLNGSNLDRGHIDFCPTAVTVSAVTKTQTVIPIQNAIDVDLVNVKTYAYLGNEIVRVDAITSNSVTVGRGCIDTVPSSHAAGTRLFFIDEFGGSDQYEYVSGETAQIRLRPVTPLGTLPFSSAPTIYQSFSRRHYKPYPPGYFRFNGLSYPAQLLGPIQISWAHRDRLQQTGLNIIDTTSGSIGPEPGVTYSVTIERYTGSSWTSVRTISGITGFTYTWSTEASDIPDGVPSLQRFTLYSVRSGINSHQSHEHVAERIGLGYNLGNFLGGA